MGWSDQLFGNFRETGKIIGNQAFGVIENLGFGSFVVFRSGLHAARPTAFKRLAFVIKDDFCTIFCHPGCQCRPGKAAANNVNFPRREGCHMPAPL